MIEQEVQFEIEKMPVPKRPGRKTTLQYPIGELAIGSDESFLVPATPETMKKVLTSVRTFAYRNGFRIIMRQVPEGIRVWRKA